MLISLKLLAAMWSMLGHQRDMYLHFSVTIDLCISPFHDNVMRIPDSMVQTS